MREVFLSVDSLRFPMMSAHGTRYSPAGKVLGRVPGITTERAGTRPRYSTSTGPDTSRIAVDEVSVVPAARTYSVTCAE